jgi:hypothetical protein
MQQPWIRSLSILILAALWVTIGALPAWAHRPYFEEQDLVADAPWWVEDPTISTAIYATLESPQDVDYFAFQGQAGERILVALTIPQIEGQDEFAPTMALIGPGLPQGKLPSQVAGAEGTGALVLEPAPGPAPTFFEPFSRTSYWDRQEERALLPEDGLYTVAVWHPQGEMGRYVFVVGDRELPGGDPAFPLKMRAYWTPVGTPVPARRAWWLAFVGLGLVLALGAALTVWIIWRVRRKRAASQSQPGRHRSSEA